MIDVDVIRIGEARVPRAEIDKTESLLFECNDDQNVPFRRPLRIVRRVSRPDRIKLCDVVVDVPLGEKDANRYEGSIALHAPLPILRLRLHRRTCLG